MSVTAIIAGQGALPGVLAGRLSAQGASFVVAELEGFACDVPGAVPIRFRVERLVPFLDHLAQLGVDRVVLAGAVRRPKLEPELFDSRTAQLVPRLVRAIQSGDDAALREVIAIFEDWDFRVVGAEEIAPDLLPEAGVPTRALPDEGIGALALLGETAVAEMGAADQGQACVVAGGAVILREGADGTDAMLARLAVPSPPDADWTAPFTGLMDMAADAAGAAADWLTGGPRGPAVAPVDGRGGILFKAPKPGQERRADLPVIGVETARRAARTGLSGIVIEAGGVMILDLPQVLQILDARDLFLWVRPRGGT